MSGSRTWAPSPPRTPRSTRCSAVRKVTPAGAITEYAAALGTEPLDLTKGPDGNLWFTDGGTPAIGRITPSGTISTFTTGLNAGSDPIEIAAGSDGSLWFTDQGSTPALGRITTTGTITEYSAGLQVGSKPVGPAAGPDGNLWFTTYGSATPGVGRITPGGGITEYSSGLGAGSAPSGGAVAGPDGNMWFADDGTTHAIGQIVLGSESPSVAEVGGSGPSSGGSGPTAPPPATAPVHRKKPLKCKRGYRKTVKHGKARCVKRNHRHHRARKGGRS